MDKWQDRVLISRQAVTKEDGVYDERGYCDTKIPYGGSIYWVAVDNGNGETMCAECALHTLLQQLATTGTIPEYLDNWFNDWHKMQEVVKDG